MKRCPFCCEGRLDERIRTEFFEYGAGDDAVVLSAEVMVQECPDPTCRMAWTDYRAEDARQAAVEKHLATKGIYLCGICREMPVDVEQGIDTCDNCIGRV